MDKDSLLAKVERVEEVLSECASLDREASQVVRTLCEVFSTRAATHLVSFVSTFHPGEINAARSIATTEVFSLRFCMPGAEAVRTATPKLIDAVASGDGAGAATAIKEMGLFVLCPAPEQQMDRLEFIVGCVVGRQRLIPLVELALFAAEQGAYARANKFTSEAYALGPGPPELHDLLTVRGFVALEAAAVADAKDYLIESARVCDGDGACRIRAFNTMLAEKLLDLEQQDAVVRYLQSCSVIWARHREQILAVIRAIEDGRRPESLCSGLLAVMNRPALRLRQLLVRASFLGSGADRQVPREGGAKGTTTDNRAEYQRRNRASIGGKLETGRN